MKIALDSAILFALVTSFIMTYSLSATGTSYVLFGLIFLTLFIFILLDIVKLRGHTYQLFKNILLWFTIVVVIGSAFIAAIIVRYKTSPVYMIHDIVLQQESAIRFLLDGKNPYAVTYFGTPLEQWHYSDTEVNPALYHFVMQPFYLLFAMPFYFVSVPLVGFFDGRMPLLFLFILLLIFASLLIENQEKKRLFIILLAFNPAMLPYTLEGRSDIFMFSFLFLGLYLLYRKRFVLAGVPIGLAFAVKQSAWPFLPFYIAFLYFQKKRVLATLKAVIPFLITFSVIILPSFFWDKKAFLDSTIFYLSGTGPNSYPISGYGLGKLLNQFEVIKDVHQYYPFVIWQTIIGLPLLVILIRHLKKSPTVGRLLVAYGIFLFVFWYLSRYFNNSHVGYLSMVFITAHFWPEDSKKLAKE